MEIMILNSDSLPGMNQNFQKKLEYMNPQTKHTFITTIRTNNNDNYFVNYIHSWKYRWGTEITNRIHQVDPGIDSAIEVPEALEHPFGLVVFFDTFSWP